LKSNIFLIFSILFLIFSLAITFRVNDKPSNTEKTTQSDIHTTPPPLESSRSNEDMNLLEIFRDNLELSNQIAKELDLLISTYQQTDELEAAVEAMEIAKDESSKVLQESQLHFNPQDQQLVNMKTQFEQQVSLYIDGLSMQLNGILEGDGHSITKGFEMVQNAKTQLNELLVNLQKP